MMHGYFSYQIFTIMVPGAYPIAEGRNVTFAEVDLRMMQTAYNELKPQRHAPLVVGHPEDDRPSHGYIDSLKLIDDKHLIGYGHEMSHGLHSGLREGLYRRYGAQFFAPDNPKNPVPGIWFLKHLGFIGPEPPVYRGELTTEVKFAESSPGMGRPTLSSRIAVKTIQ